MIDMHAIESSGPISVISVDSRALRVAEMTTDAGLPVVPHSGNHSMMTVFTMHMLAAVDNAGEYFEYCIEATGPKDSLNRSWPSKTAK